MRALILVSGAALAVASCHNDGRANNTMNMDDEVPMAIQQNDPSPPPVTATQDEETSQTSTVDEESAASSSSADEE